MKGEREILLRVVDEAGAAVAGALVSVPRSTVAFPEIALVSDGQGLVRLTLPEGRFVIAAHGGDRRQGQLELDSGTQDPAETIILTLRPAP